MGNKTEEPRLLSEEDGQRYAKNFKIPYIETSAKTGKNVKEMFEMIIKRSMKAWICLILIRTSQATK